MAFDAKKHLIRLQGGREYLPVAYRLVWFRQEHAGWGIQTEPIVCDVEKGVYVWHARITDETGRVMAEGTKMETALGFADATEKSETGAIGRALGVLGYGTQFCAEFDEGERLADSPIPIANRDGKLRAGSKPHAANIGRDFAKCQECGRPLTKGQEGLSSKRFGRPLCPAHQEQVIPST
jgi:hypothetical protein